MATVVYHNLIARMKGGDLFKAEINLQELAPFTYISPENFSMIDMLGLHPLR